MAAANPRSVEASGKTVDDAVLQALRRLGLSRGQVEVSVITEGRPGVFGIGATEARVHVSAIGAGRDDSDDAAAPLPKIDDYADYAEVDARPRPDRGRGRGRPAGGRSQAPGRAPSRSAPSPAPAERDRSPRPSVARREGGDRRRGGGGGRGRGRDPDPIMPREPLPFELTADPDFEPEDDQDPTQFALAVLTDLVRLMKLEADVTAREPETPMDGLDHAVAVLDVTSSAGGEDLDLLVGRRGEHLAALQYIVNLIVNRALEGRHAFTVDVDGYKRQREQTIEALAKEVADEVRESHATVELEPMPAAERRIVHLTLSEDPEIETESAGAGDARRVQIVYRDA